MTQKQKKRRNDALISLLALVVGLIIVFPVLYGILGAFKSEAEFAAYPPTLFPKSFGYTENFETVWRQIPVLRFFFNSFVVALLSTSVRLLCAIFAAYAFVFYEFRGKKFFFFLFVVDL